MDGGQHLLKEKEVQALTGLALSTLRTYRRLGKGPAYLKIGRAIRYDNNDVLAWLDIHRIDTHQNSQVIRDGKNG